MTEHDEEVAELWQRALDSLDASVPPPSSPC